MSNNQNSITLSISSEKMELLKQFMSQNQISENDLKLMVRKPKDHFTYIDETNSIATCNACSNEFNTNDIPDIHQERCRKSGICPDCAAQFTKTEALQNILKSKNIKNNGAKVVINGGKAVGKRLQQMFSDVIASENFTEEILAKFLDVDYSNKTLKFASYPFLIDISDISDEEMKNNRNYYKRFYSKPYTIFDHKVKLCSQIFDAQFNACLKEFRNLGLIDEEVNY